VTELPPIAVSGLTVRVGYRKKRKNTDSHSAGIAGNPAPGPRPGPKVKSRPIGVSSVRTMAYGSVECGTPLQSTSPRRTQALRFILIALAATAASCLVAIHFAHRSVSLAGPGDIHQMEVNAYMTSSEAEEFKKLESEQTMINAGMPGLLAQEAKMKAEDTKVKLSSSAVNS
jgi:hypothetical protein